MRIDRPSLRRNNLRCLGVFSFAALAIILACALPTASPVTAKQDQQTGYLEIVTHLSPSGGHAEPAHGLTLYLLRKSYSAIVKEADAAEPLPKMDDYIAGLELTPQLKAWMVKHQIVELSGPAFPKANHRRRRLEYSRIQSSLHGSQRRRSHCRPSHIPRS